MASTWDSDSSNSRTSIKTHGGEKVNDLIQLLQDILQRSSGRSSLKLDREGSREAGPAGRYGTSVVCKRRKPLITAAEKYEKTVNALRTRLGKYWEGHGISKSYEYKRGKGRVD